MGMGRWVGRSCHREQVTGCDSGFGCQGLGREGRGRESKAASSTGSIVGHFVGQSTAATESGCT